MNQKEEWNILLFFWEISEDSIDFCYVCRRFSPENIVCQKKLCYYD